MKLVRLSLALTALVVLAGVAYVNQASESTGVKMTKAADKFMASLDAKQKAKASFAFDDKERLNWHFVPLQDKDRKATRKGLPLEAMSKEQRALALELLKAGTSNDGYVKATTIMSLEEILRGLEKGKSVRNPDWYFFAVFGTPSATGKWGWRVEGHHLSLNFVIDKGTVVAATPAFFGANPADIKSGDRKGQRVLPESVDPVRELVKSLSTEQQTAALQKTHFPEIPGRTSTPKVGDPVGLAAAKMNDKQKALLLKTLEGYAARMPAEVAQVELKQLKDAGIDKIHFAYSGSLEPGKPCTYRIQGPTFVVDFLDTQSDSARNPANHIHSIWRRIKGDFAQ